MTVEERIRDHLALAIAIARRTVPPHPYNHDDLESVAIEALWNAARDYKPGHGAKFSSYAGNIIRWRLVDWCRANSWAFTRTNGKGQRRAAVTSMDRKLANTGTNGGGAEKDQDYHKLHPARPDDTTRLERAELLHALPVRERLIVLLVEQGWTLREIGDRLDVTESRISQIVTRAGQRLQKRGLLAA